MDIAFRLNAPLSARQLADLFKSSGIRRPTHDLPRLQRMIEGANLTITAWAGDNLVGVARALTDFSYCCYLSDLAVHLDYQRQGIGSELIRRVQEAIGEECALILLSAPDAMPYYEKLGMESAPNAWIIRRKV